MARQLLIMRHAKSAWDTDVSSDFDRPLAKRGQRDAPRMGNWIRDQKLIPDVILSSPAERAKQTIQAVVMAMGLNKKKISWDKRIYGAGSEDLLDVLAEIPKKNKVVLLMGHNPGLEFLVEYLVGSMPRNTSFDVGESGVEVGLVRTATVVVLKMPDDWDNMASGCATIQTVQHPRDLD